MELPGQGDTQLAMLKAFATRGFLTIPRVFLDALSNHDQMDYAGIGRLTVLLAYGETRDGNPLRIWVPRTHPDAVMLRRIIQDLSTLVVLDAREEPDGTVVADLSPLMELALAWLEKHRQAEADPSQSFRGQVLQRTHPLVLRIEEQRKGQRLTPRELELLIEWHQELGLDIPVIQHLIDYAAERGKLHHFNYINKIAISWSERGIRTLEDLRRLGDELFPHRLVAREVLRELGMTRQVTPADEELVARWLDDWGFDRGAVVQACRQAVRRDRPRLAEVDRILDAWHREGLRTQEDVLAYLKRVEAESEQKASAEEFYYQVLRATGISGRLLQANRALIDKWRDLWGMEPSVILFACQQAANAGIHRLDYVDAILSRYRDLDIRTVDQAAAQEAEWRRSRSAQMPAVRRPSGRRSSGSALPPNMQLPKQGDDDYYEQFAKKIVPKKGSPEGGPDPATAG